jgi:hypothetical protein
LRGRADTVPEPQFIYGSAEPRIKRAVARDQDRVGAGVRPDGVIGRNTDAIPQIMR